jgi:uncharacterized membrane protein
VAANRIPALGLLWMALAAAYLAASALGQREATLAVLGVMGGTLVAALGHRLAGLVLGLALATAGWQFAASLPLLAFLPPLAAFAGLAAFFGRTLRAGSEPFVSRIARREHPDLPRDLARHARALTALWTGCFVLLFFLALALAFALPLGTWSRWVHGLGYAVPAALFLGEHAYRRWRFPGRTHGSLAALVPSVLSVMREMAGETATPVRHAGGPR